MIGPLKTQSEVASPLASRAVQARVVSLEEAQRDAIQVYYGSMTKKALASALIAMFFVFVIGYSAANAPKMKAADQHQLGGAVVLLACMAGLAYVIYDYRQKQRVFLLEDSFAVERRLSSEVDLIPWADVAKLYCLDRATVTRVSIHFIPVGSTTSHQGKLRIKLVDGREIVLTNRVRDFSAMARQFQSRTAAAQLEPCARFLMDGGVLDFDRLGLASDGLIHKRKLLAWADIQRISLNDQGGLLFKTAKFWRSPRFSTDALPNSALLLKLVGMFGGELSRA